MYKDKKCIHPVAYISDCWEHDLQTVNRSHKYDNNISGCRLRLVQEMVRLEIATVEDIELIITASHHDILFMWDKLFNDHPFWDYGADEYVDTFISPKTYPVYYRVSCARETEAWATARKKKSK